LGRRFLQRFSLPRISIHGSTVLEAAPLNWQALTVSTGSPGKRGSRFGLASDSYRFGLKANTSESLIFIGLGY
jgi:hypothetical protein